MWIFLPDAFLSIVDKGGDGDTLLVRALRYPNFKASISDPARHEACHRVWAVMLKEQHRGADPGPAEPSASAQNPPAEAAGTDPRDSKEGNGMSGKYEPLERHLRSVPRNVAEITLSFAELARILGASLPRSAFFHREWWSNQTDTTNRPQARAWTRAGFAVESVHQDPTGGWVRFRRR